MDTNSVFILNLRRLRKEKGLSQEEFSAKVGLSVRGYQLYEQGGSAPTPEILDRFAQALGCRPTDFLEDKTKPKRDDVKAAALMLSTFADLPPDHQKVILALIYKDPSLARGLSGQVDQKFQALLRAL